MLATPRFLQLWKNANRTAHETLINIIEDKGNVVSTSGGKSTLKLGPDHPGVKPARVGRQHRRQAAPDAGNLKILRSDQLGLAQTIAKVIRGLALVTTLLRSPSPLAIYLSRGYRWITVLGVGVGLILVGILVLILRDVAGKVVVDQLASDVVKPAAEATWSIGTSLLASIARTVIVYGGFFVLAVLAASRTPARWRPAAR